MPLLDRNGWKPDEFRRDGAAGSGFHRIVPLAALEEAIAAGPSTAKIGVDLANDVRSETLVDLQDRIDLIAIAFPHFSDGRGFSLARALRQQGYGGVLRAFGHLIPDQFAFALACGFDEVEIDEDRLARQPVEHWLEALRSIGDSYQNKDEQPSVFVKRAAAG